MQIENNKLQEGRNLVVSDAYTKNKELHPSQETSRTNHHRTLRTYL